MEIFKIKKLFGMILLAGLVLGCDFEEQKSGTITVKNESSKFDVSYTIGNISGTTIQGAENTYNLPLYSYMKSYDNNKRVTLKTEYPYKNDILYTFSDRTSYEVKITNLTGADAQLEADGWMETITGITPKTTEQSDSAWKVYTDQPVFTATINDGYPAIVGYNFSSDIFLVTIR
jgi:hypothetical protein